MRILQTMGLQEVIAHLLCLSKRKTARLVYSLDTSQYEHLKMGHSS